MTPTQLAAFRAAHQRAMLALEEAMALCRREIDRINADRIACNAAPIDFAQEPRQ